MGEEMFYLLSRASTYEPTSSFLPQLDKHRQEGGVAILSLVFGGSPSFNLARRHEHFGPRGSLVTKGLMTGLSRVMTYDIFGGAHSAKV